MTDLIKTMLARARGRKTYAVVFLGLVYLAGCGLGFWEYDSELINAIVLAAVAALRAGVARGAS